MERIKRCKYQKNPLIEVRCQFSFPTILTIEADEPAAFQELIRANFPNYRMGIAQERQIDLNISEENIQPTLTKTVDKKIYLFVSDDGKWKITLSSNSISIATLNYVKWEDFLARLEEPLNSFVETYKPTYFTRIGLRYIDVFDKKKFGLEEVKWKDLIKPHLLGCLGYEHVDEETITSNVVQFDISFNDIKVKVKTGLGNLKGDTDTNFIEDCSYYIERKIDVTEYQHVCDLLHDKSVEFFKDSITDRLHDAMKPVEL